MDKAQVTTPAWEIRIANLHLVGTVELLGLLASKAGLHGVFWDWIAGVDLNSVGYLIIGLFVGTWLIALLVWKACSVEKRWATGGAAEMSAEWPAD
ncbi:hypothetical protein [Streptomyces sp. S.PB5]|uniref:HoxN/HupN/NixA family nickel/cobalt transporter n=1 Tax=Streptomyces sp. S.PB5 TaxID=3020844 RepID=UPI00339D5816